MYQGGQSFSPFIDFFIHHQFGHHRHLFFFFLMHFQTLATFSCLELRRNYPVARLPPWTARQCTGRVVEAGVDTISSSPFPRLRMWTLSASVLVKVLFFSVRTRHFSDTLPVTSLDCGVECTLTSTASVPMAMRSLSLPWPDQTRHGGGALRGETRSPAETEIHYKYSIIFL